MKRIFSYILILAVILQIFAPFTVGDKNDGFVTKKIVKAETWEEKNSVETLETTDWTINGFKNNFPGSFIKSNGSLYSKDNGYPDLSLGVVIDTGFREGTSAFWRWWKVKPEGGVVNWIFNGLKYQKGLDLLFGKDYEREFENTNAFIVTITETDTGLSGYIDLTNKILAGNIKTGRNRVDTDDAMPVKISTVISIQNNITPLEDSKLTHLNPGKTYKISLYYLAVKNSDGSVGEIIKGLDGDGNNYVKIYEEDIPVASETNQIITTGMEDQVVGGSVAGSSGDNMPACNLITGGWNGFYGCIIRTIHSLIFKPTSYLFGLTGKAVDITLKYTLSDSSYRSPFISEGWKLIRDLCNMFFIFILLYIAFTTILDTVGVKGKASVVNVIIIGLVINFSLFTTHLIIDASNVLARVFYNPEVILVGAKNASGQVESKTGEYGEIKVTEAIVSKINPQKLMLQQDPVGTKSAEAISASNYLLIEILAIGVNIAGMVVFISISFALIARVVGLWLAMILSPLAFFTYAVPQLKNIDYIGWSKWWPETLSAAFMAPVFVFFLYIIAVFIDSGLGLSSLSSNPTGLNKVISIIIAFAFVMFLLMTAKKVAIGMAGKVAEKVSSGLKTVGGLALGGAAVGTGAILRNVVGGTVAKASRGETSVQKFEAARRAQLQYSDDSLMKKLTPWQKTKGAITSYATGGFLNNGNGSLAGKIAGQTTIAQNIHTRKVEEIEVEKGLGGLVNRKQEYVDKINKARNKWDETKKDAGLENTDDKNLSSKDVKNMKKKFKDKNKGEYETEAKNGEIGLRDASGQEVMSKIYPNQKIKGEKSFKADIQNDVTTKYIAEQAAAGRVITARTLTPADTKKIKEKIDMEFRAILKTTVDYRSNEKFKETRDNSNKNISMTDRGIAGANRASYDVRNLTNLKSDKRDSIFSKIPVALITAIAAGVRAGIKGSGMSSGGIKSQGAFLKDMGNVISDSLKISKINVELGGKNKNN